MGDVIPNRDGRSAVIVQNQPMQTLLLQPLNQATKLMQLPKNDAGQLSCREWITDRSNIEAHLTRAQLPKCATACVKKGKLQSERKTRLHSQPTKT